MAQSEQSPPPVCEAESHQLLSQKYTLLLMAGKRGRAFTGICVPQMHLNESDYIVDYPLALPSVFGDGGERIGDTIQETLDSFDTPRNKVGSFFSIWIPLIQIIQTNPRGFLQLQP